MQISMRQQMVAEKSESWELCMGVLLHAAQLTSFSDIWTNDIASLNIIALIYKMVKLDRGFLNPINALFS